MSLENEDGSSAMEASEAIDESQKKPNISYTRDFLMSLSDLEICKRLPSDFDQSVLSEIEDTSRGVQERPRTHGSLPLQGFRRGDYSSSPPTRGAGVYGRWDNRSSGWSDKDGDSQSELDSDSGRRTHGSQPWRSWQNSEHDGLLGSGSFPRPSGFAAGASAPKGQTNDNYHLNRSNEAYHPPRPFKAVPHARTSTNDSFNDETFGSDECTSQDRAEEERKRRASFELMRKEQQKVLQEKQKLNANMHKSDCFTDLILEEAKEEGLSEGNDELDSAIQSVSNSRKPSSLLQSSKPRPLVPPGFKSTVLEKNSAARPLVSFTDKENPKPGIDELHLVAKGSRAQNGTLDNQGNIQSLHKLDMPEQHLGDENSSGLKMGEAIMNSSSGPTVSTEKLGMDDHHPYRTSGLPGVHEAVDGGEGFELVTNKVMGNKIIGNSNQGKTTSILEKLFGSAPIEKGGSSGFVEQQESKPDDSASPHNVHSSKFAQWFDEDVKKPGNDLSSGRPNELLSLLVGGEKAGSQVPNIISTELIQPELSYKGVDPTKVIASTVPPDPKHLYSNYRKESAPPVAAVLTCEDLEQTILLEYSEKSSMSQTPAPDWSISSEENVDAKAVDNHATHHLLSLLQKGTNIEDLKSDNTNVGSLEKHPASEIGGVTTFDKPKDANAKDGHSSGQSLTLETLFGTAFMKELQSAQAPVSVQRGSAGSARTEVFEPRDDGLLPSTVDGTGSNRTNYDNNLLVSKQKQPPRSDGIEIWSQFDGPQVDMDSLGFQKDVPKLPKQAIDGADIRLPEEESLITVGDPVNPHNPMLFAAGNTTTGRPLESDATFDIAEKLAALNSGFRGERSMTAQEGARFVRGPYDLLEPERQYSNLHNQAPSPQMNHARRAMFHPLDPNPHMRFPEHLMQRDTPPGHQFPPNMLRPPFRHPDTRVTGFDVSAHHQMLPQMQMPGNFPPPHLLRDFPRPSAVHPHPSNQATNFMPEREAMHGFPFARGQSNIGGLGMPLPDAGSRNTHPEALQRIMEMELRAQSKQIRPLNAPHSQGTYGHELDMGFRYR